MDLYAYMYHTLGDVFVSVDVRSGPDRKNVFFQSPKVTPVAQSRVGSFILPEPIVHVLHIADGIYLFFRRKNGRRSATRPVAGRRAGSVNSGQNRALSVCSDLRLGVRCLPKKNTSLLLLTFGLRLTFGSFWFAFVRWAAAKQRLRRSAVPRFNIDQAFCFL